MYFTIYAAEQQKQFFHDESLLKVVFYIKQGDVVVCVSLSIIRDGFCHSLSFLCLVETVSIAVKV